MRQVLFRIDLMHPWSWWNTPGGGDPLLGAGFVWLIGGLLYFGFHALRRHQEIVRSLSAWGVWGLGFVVLTAGPTLGRWPGSIPIFGYGMMVLIGFLSALQFAYWRAQKVGFNPEVVMDSAFWLLVSGVLGGRLAFLLQYWDRVFAPTQNVGQMLMAAVNLTEGGLVLIGALVGGAIGFFTFCWVRKVSALEFADILVPGIFIGIGFGRIGCLLNGCCFGDRCDLPWGITFPQGSVTFDILANWGFIDPAAARTIPLHPTQIYSSLDGFILAFVTATFYWYRRFPGDVLALGCILYPLTRIQIEFLRSDEMGQFGTGLTISQLYSIIILVFGLILLASGPWRGRWSRGLGTSLTQRPAS